ncbi:MAG: Beta-lactamase [Candidatus Saccharicenans subterraneus]|uniref:Beta-lactamase n=1 Tax=Candidatus Saccharicenans subterraneus TaxID=2508984 RepID=A0A3E2BMG6_9BACT|nr:MAG: Beta-lactamase [Candidatus Saccharicenans subterraneum]
MRNKFFLISFATMLIFLGTWLTSFAQEKKADKKDYSEALRLIDIWLEAQRDYERLPGMSAAVVDDQAVIFSRAYGLADLEKKVKTTPETIYSICSISKLFTAVAIMQLRDAGKLRLDDEVGDHLPWFNIKQQYPDGGPITIRSLLTHSSGLPRESDYPYWSKPDFHFPSREQLKEKLGAQKTLYPPSTYFQYSNLGLSLLGEIVAEVSGKSYDDYVQEKILKPLGMNDTRPYLPKELWRNRLATGYSSLTRNGTRDMLPFFQAEGIKPAAGFSSTVLDLARFASWQFRLLARGGEEILKAPSLREMHRVHWMDPDWKTSWGLGFSVYELDGKTIVGHSGSCPGYRSTLMIDPNKKQAFVVMINASGTEPEKYARGMREILKKATAKIEGEKGTGVNLEDYAGYYDEQPWWGETVVIPWQGKLAMVSLPADNPVQGLILLKHIEGDTFRRIRDDETLGEEVIFERDKSGKVFRFVQHSNFSPKLRSLR